MSSNSSNSRMAVQRSHSLRRRWSSGNGRRRRSGRGGKSGARTSAQLASLPLPPFQPHQKTIAQHDGDGVAMKTIPAPSLILIPAQLGFGFLMILLDPVTAVGILDHRGPRHGGREVTPEILPVSVLAAAGALPKQPAHMAAAIAIDPPTAQRHKLGPPPAFGSFTPGNGLPVLERLRRQQRISPQAKNSASSGRGARGACGNRARFWVLRLILVGYRRFTDPDKVVVGATTRRRQYTMRNW